jgi:hypothetical protein
MAATATMPTRPMSALTEKVYETGWESPALSTAAFSHTKNSLLTANRIEPKIVVTVPREPPKWFSVTLASLTRLLNLQDNWDSYGGRKPQHIAVIQGLKLLSQVMANNTPAPSVVPLSDGGIQFEWHRKSQDLEIAFLVGELPTFYYQHREKEEEKEGPATDINLLANLVEGIS